MPALCQKKVTVDALNLGFESSTSILRVLAQERHEQCPLVLGESFRCARGALQTLVVAKQHGRQLKSLFQVNQSQLAKQLITHCLNRRRQSTLALLLPVVNMHPRDVIADCDAGRRYTQALVLKLVRVEPHVGVMRRREYLDVLHVGSPIGN